MIVKGIEFTHINTFVLPPQQGKPEYRRDFYHSTGVGDDRIILVVESNGDSPSHWYCYSTLVDRAEWGIDPTPELAFDRYTKRHRKAMRELFQEIEHKTNVLERMKQVQQVINKASKEQP
jgi:hypothetical protein